MRNMTFKIKLKYKSNPPTGNLEYSKCHIANIIFKVD